MGLQGKPGSAIALRGLPALQVAEYLLATKHGVGGVAAGQLATALKVRSGGYRAVGEVWQSILRGLRSDE